MLEGRCIGRVYGGGALVLSGVRGGTLGSLPKIASSAVEVALVRGAASSDSLVRAGDTSG